MKVVSIINAVILLLSQGNTGKSDVHLFHLFTMLFRLILVRMETIRCKIFTQLTKQSHIIVENIIEYIELFLNNISIEKK